MKSANTIWLRQSVPVSLIWLAAGILQGQDLTPRAYVITPTGSNAVTLAYSFTTGAVFTDPVLPIADFNARSHAEVFSYYHSFSVFGRSANAVVSVPYALGNFRATVAGTEGQIYRSGLADVRVRFSINLRGGPAMKMREFAEWRERTTLGASLTAVVPSGQYDPGRLINNSVNRWAVKPEVGFSRRYGRWSLDLYGGVWFFAANRSFFPGDNVRRQAPVESGELHLVRYLTRRCWLSFDSNFWTGGRTTVSGSRKADYQRNSRAGATAAILLNRHQSIKVSYSKGTYISIGGDYHNLSLAWQYSWITGVH